MKNPKRPTRKQKERLKSLGLSPRHWLIIKDSPFTIIHRVSDEVRRLGA